MARRRAAGRSNGGAQLGAVEAQVKTLAENARDMRAEATALRLEVAGRIDRHEIVDDAHHGESISRVERLERETLEGAKMVIARVETLERDLAGRPHVDARVAALERDMVARPSASSLELRFGGIERAVTLVTTIPTLDARVEALERRGEIKDAVSKDRKWLLTAVVFGGIALFLNALRALDQIPQVLKLFTR